MEPAGANALGAHAYPDLAASWQPSFLLLIPAVPSQAEPAFLIDGRAGNAIMSPLLALNTRQL